MQWLSATITAYVLENHILKKFSAFLWPRLKTLRLAEDLRRQGKLDEEKLRNLPKVRYFRHKYFNIFVFLPFGFYILVFLISILLYGYPVTLKSFLAFSISAGFIYLSLWDDAQDEWKYVSLVTHGKRTAGQVIKCRKSTVGNAINASFTFMKDNGIESVGYMFLWHGVAPRFYFLPGEEVEVAYDPTNPKKSIIITDEVEAFNLRKAAKNYE